MTGADKPSASRKEADDVKQWAATICARLREIDVELASADPERNLALLEEQASAAINIAAGLIIKSQIRFNSQPANLPAVNAIPAKTSH